MTTVVSGHNEKMLPPSYSIAAWPHWLCITSDTVCCITTTCEANCGARSRPLPKKRAPRPGRARSSVGLILRNTVASTCSNQRVRHGSHSALLVCDRLELTLRHDLTVSNVRISRPIDVPVH